MGIYLPLAFKFNLKYLTNFYEDRRKFNYS